MGRDLRYSNECAFKRGLIKEEVAKNLSYEETEAICPYRGSLWGPNLRSEAIRARKLLGWEPKEEPIKEDIPRALDVEVKALGRK